MYFRFIPVKGCQHNMVTWLLLSLKCITILGINSSLQKIFVAYFVLTELMKKKDYSLIQLQKY